MKPQRHIIPVFVPHLGCPNECVFCNQRRISGSTDQASAETVIKAIAKAKTILPSEAKAELAFYGGSFTAIHRDRQEELLRAAFPYYADGFLSGIRISTRPDAINTETLAVLRQYGVKTIELGAQSMNPEVLKRSKRGHSTEDIVNSSKLIKSLGFQLILQMMTGLPGDTAHRARMTAEALADLEPDGVRIYPTVIIKETALQKMWETGMYDEHGVEEAAELCTELFFIFNRRGIPVIRMGLNPTEALTGGDAIAGAYHPAFGELVYTKVFLSKARELLSSQKHGKDIVLGVHQSRVSAMAGHKRSNINILISEFNLSSLKIRQTETEPDNIQLITKKPE
ncbi:MAG: radical SAM protein [Clostridiales bacterium]|nr:radical SAM protein [Clostridiales bacterium]